MTLHVHVAWGEGSPVSSFPGKGGCYKYHFISVYVTYRFFFNFFFRFQNVSVATVTPFAAQMELDIYVDLVRNVTQ